MRWNQRGEASPTVDAWLAFRVLVVLALAGVLFPPFGVASTASAATSAQITITGSTGVPNRVGDNETSLAVDGDTATGTFTTPSGTLNDSPAYLEFAFDSTPVNHIRLYKNNEYGPHDLTIEFSTDTDPLAEGSTWAPVSGLSNGFAGSELLNAGSVNTDGTVTGDVHDSSPGSDGWASLTFDTVTATALRIAFTSTGSNNHYRVFEFEASFSLTAAISVGSLQSTPTNTSPVRFDVTFAGPVTGFDAADVSVTGTSGGGGVAVTDLGAQTAFTVDVTPNGDGTVIASIPADAVVDGAGNNNFASGSASITYDTAAPVLGPVSTALKGSKLTAKFSASGAVGFTCQIAGSSSYGSGCSSPFTISLAAGSYTFTVTALDQAGNEATSSPAAFTIKSKKVRA